MKIKVYIPQTTSRLNYAIDLVLAQVGELEYTLVYHIEEIKEGDFVLNYSGSIIENSFHIHPHGLLFEKDIQNYDVPFDYRKDAFLVGVFPTEFDDLGFDIFSASFYIATRYEEYRKAALDEHGRYLPSNSLQSKIGILKRPIINIWVKELLRLFSEKWKIDFAVKRNFEIINTIDVDHAWAYQNKGVLRGVGGISKTMLQGDFKLTKTRINTMVKSEKDPYDTYDYLENVQEKYSVRSIYFFLLGDYKKPYDTSVSHTNKALIDLIKKLQNYASIGIHPSYESYLNPKKILKEIERLSAITQIKTTQSRQHFLRLSIPESYRVLETLGIKEDYTMGYAQEVGFRAGLCTPFYLFDLLLDKVIDVKIHSFAYMDGTLNEYMKISPDEAKETIKFLKEQVQNVQGQFIGIWHNSSVHDRDEWEGWREVYEWGIS